MPNGLSDPEDPKQANWGGYHLYGLCPDSLTYAWTSWEQPTNTITCNYKTRFYPDELNDFMARMQWADEGRGNTNPHVVVNGKKGTSVIRLKAKAGKQLHLDASRSYDREGDTLSFLWWQQQEAGSYQKPLAITSSTSSAITLNIPADAAGKDLHLVCEVHDDGPFNLVAYRRIIITVE